MDTDAGGGFLTNQAIKHGLWIITSPLPRNPGGSSVLPETRGPLFAARALRREVPVWCGPTGRVKRPAGQNRNTFWIEGGLISGAAGEVHARP